MNTERLNLKWSHREYQGIFLIGGIINGFLQQITFSGSNNILREEQCSLTTLIVRLVQAYNQPIAILRRFHRLNNDMLTIGTDE